MVYVAWVGRVSAAMFVFLSGDLTDFTIQNALDLVRLDRAMILITAKVLRCIKKEYRMPASIIDEFGSSST